MYYKTKGTDASRLVLYILLIITLFTFKPTPAHSAFICAATGCAHQEEHPPLLVLHMYQKHLASFFNHIQYLLENDLDGLISRTALTMLGMDSLMAEQITDQFRNYILSDNYNGWVPSTVSSGAHDILDFHEQITFNNLSDPAPTIRRRIHYPHDRRRLGSMFQASNRRQFAPRRITLPRSENPRRLTIPYHIPDRRVTLFHLTNREGYIGILNQRSLNASTGRGAAIAGDGQYLTDLGGTGQIQGWTDNESIRDEGQISHQSLHQLLYLNKQYLTTRMSHFIEINIQEMAIRQYYRRDGLTLRRNVYVLWNSDPLDITNLIVSAGLITIRAVPAALPAP